MDFIAKNSEYVALTEVLARHMSRLHVILDAARLLNSTLDLYELTTIILEIIRSEVPVERVSVFVVDQKQRFVRSLVAQGAQGEITLPIGIGIAGFVAETCQTLDVTDAYQDARFNPEFDRALGYRTKDILAVPVFNGTGVVVGILELLNRSKPISEDDHEFLRGVSIFIGLALEKAWYCRELEDKENVAERLLPRHGRASDKVTGYALALIGTRSTPAGFEVRQEAAWSPAQSDEEAQSDGMKMAGDKWPSGDGWSCQVAIRKVDAVPDLKQQS